MTPGVILPSSDEQNSHKHLQKQMGCMARFFQIFDRRHRRIYAPKRLQSPPATGSNPSSSSDETSEMFPSSPENPTDSPAITAVQIPVTAFDVKERLKISWKLREAPRLSLDSRLRPQKGATGSDEDRRLPSVVARLMGLDALPDGGGVPINRSELRRSASESGVSKDLRRLVENDGLSQKFRSGSEPRKATPPVPPPRRSQSRPQPIQRKSHFNSQDFFPEPNRKRGIDEAAEEVESLKQILEALQMKGLLRSNSKISWSLVSNRPPIVVMRPGPKTVGRSEPVRRRPAEGKPARSRSPRSIDPNPRRDAVSPRSSPRRMTPDPVTARSPRSRRLVRERVNSPAEEEGDTATVMSESSVTSSSLLDRERSRAGQNLLQRCNKLLNSIAAFTANDQQPSPVSVLDSSFLGEDNSPSPVKKRSVVFEDPKVEWEDEDCRVEARPDGMPESDFPDYAYVSEVVSAYGRFPNLSRDAYLSLERRWRRNATDASGQSTLGRRVLFDMVCEILDRKRRSSPWESFSRRRPPTCGGRLAGEVWEQVRRAREGAVGGGGGDPNEVTCRAVRKDVAAGEHGWGSTEAEMSEAVLHLERLVFKDLVGEVIQDLADAAAGAGGETRNPTLRRKLLF